MLSRVLRPPASEMVKPEQLEAVVVSVGCVAAGDEVDRNVGI